MQKDDRTAPAAGYVLDLYQQLKCQIKNARESIQTSSVIGL